MTNMNVLSLFGGAEAGRMALEKLGIVPTSYFSAEFDPYPVKLSSANYPDIVHIESVTEVSVHLAVNPIRDCETCHLIKHQHGESYVDGKIDWLIGGPPCQDLSIAGKRAGLIDGKRSSLFFEYVRILKETKPKFFLVENVASMPKEAKELMTAELFGIEPVLINSSLVSAQSRKRLYWLGRRNEDGTYSRIEIPQPEDRRIVLRDVLEDIPFDAANAKGEPIWKPVPEKYLESVREKIAKFEESKKRIMEIGFYTLPRGTNHGVLNEEKTHAVSRSNWEANNLLIAQERRNYVRISDNQDKDEAKATAVTTCFVTNVAVTEPSYLWRKLTVRECARLQTFPETYSFDAVSASRAYKAIGNSWTVDAIAHIFRKMIDA